MAHALKERAGRKPRRGRDHSLRLLSFLRNTSPQWLLYSFQLTRSLCLPFLFFIASDI